MMFVIQCTESRRETRRLDSEHDVALLSLVEHRNPSCGDGADKMRRKGGLIIDILLTGRT